MPPSDLGLTTNGALPSEGMYKKSSLLLDQSEAAQQSAMDYLQQSLASQRDISPSQGIAAALLAAIPTLGGYLIGKSVGTTKIPTGLYGAGVKNLAPTGAFAGGLAGSQIGADASKDYTTAIEADNLNKRKVLAAEAEIQNNRAQQLRQEANTVENQALSIDADIAKMPLELQLYAKQQQIARDAQVGAHIASRNYDNAHPPEGKTLSPAAIELGKKIGLDLSQVAPTELNVLNNVAREKRLAEGQDANLSGEKVMPPSQKTKDSLGSAVLVKEIGNKYIGQLENIAKTNPSYLEMNIAKVLPATDLGQLQKDLGLFAVQLRNAREAGIMTDKDEARYREYLTIGSLDTFNSVLGRMKELQQITDLTAKATLTSAKAGQENVSKYEELLGFKAPTSLATPQAPAGFNPQDPGYLAWKNSQGRK